MLQGSSGVYITVKGPKSISKFKKPGEPGHFFVNFEHDGNQHQYIAENEQCADTMAEHNGQSITIRATGRDQQAAIEILSTNGTVQQRKPAQQQSQGTSQASVTRPASANPEDAIKQVRGNLMQSANGMLLCLDAAEYISAQYEEKHKAQMTAEQFQAITSSLFIALDRSGHVAKLSKHPVKPRTTKQDPTLPRQPKPEPQPEYDPNELEGDDKPF